MFLICLQVLHPALLDELHHPARIEIETEADAAAELAEMLDGESQSARAGGAEHHPVGALREELVRQTLTEYLVVDPQVFADDAALGNTSGAAGLEDVDRFLVQRLGDEAPHRSSAQPAVLEQAGLLQVFNTI